MNPSSSTDHTGKVIILTGSTSGIGLASARELAASGARVYGVGRNPQRALESEQHIREAVPGARYRCLTADLSSQQQIHNLTEEIHRLLAEQGLMHVDVLVNNAAMVTNWYTTSENGYEMQFAVNHLAPFLLTRLLFPLLQAAPAARVLTTSSQSHRATRIHWKDVMLQQGYNTLRAYKQSKLANVMFSAEFNRRFAGKGPLQAFAIDPGLVNTGIGLKGTSGLVHWFWDQRRQKGAPPEKPAETMLHVALHPEVSHTSGVYWKNCSPASPSRYSLREEEAARLWRLSERLCGLPAWE